jgi:hypothetical protein
LGIKQLFTQLNTLLLLAVVEAGLTLELVVVLVDT